MILGFRVSNYRSFRDETSFSMLATRLDKEVGTAEVVAQDGTTVSALPVVAVLGANASGKSNLLRALASMREAVVRSSSRTPYDPVEQDFFRFDLEAASEPTLFEIDFSLQGSRYVYGFEVANSRFTGEWMFVHPHKRTQMVFEREGESFHFGKSLGGSKIRSVSEIIGPNNLLLSSAASAGFREMRAVFDYFWSGIQFLDVPMRATADPRTVQSLRSKKRGVVQLLAMADLGISDARVEKPDTDDERRSFLHQVFRDTMPSTMKESEREKHVESMLAGLGEKEETLSLVHRFGSSGVSLPFEEESLGTRSWLSFVTYALDALQAGGALLVDELDASLHPLLMMEAINLFQDPKTNRRGAQLIFTTHDTTLMGGSHEVLPLSRGQFWFVEKDRQGRSSLSPLSDFKPRKNENLERGYLQGRYGGTPHFLRQVSDVGETLVEP